MNSHLVTPHDSTPPPPAPIFLWFSQYKKALGKNTYFITAPLIALALALLLNQIGLFNQMENITIDFRFQSRAPHDAIGDSRLLLVSIDEPSLKQFGRWPWQRELHGNLLKLLANEEPAAVAFDLLFTEKNLEKPADDNNFAAGAGFLKGTDGLPLAIMGATSDKTAQKGAETEPAAALLPTQPLTHIIGDARKLSQTETAVYPIPNLRENVMIGFVDSDPSGKDGVRRRLPLLVKVRNDAFPTLTTQTLMRYWKIGPDQVFFHLGEYAEFHTAEGIKKVPINERGEILINYRNQDKFVSIGYMPLMVRMLRHQVKNEPWPETTPKVKDKILLVGQVAAGLTDLGPSPLESQSPLVLTHLNVLNNILKEDYLSIVANLWVALAWLIVAYVTIYYLREAPVLASIGVPLLIVAAYFGLATAFFFYRSLQFPLVWPTLSFFAIHLGAVILRWLQEQKSKQEIKSVFASYISPGVMDTLLKSPDNIQLGGLRKPVTIMFSDIRGFTTISEGMGEVELVRQLNEYFEKMVDYVNKYNGTLHKYIGDAIMAVWGDVIPLDEATDAKNAVRCSLGMKKALVLLNEFWESDGRMALKIGIGLNHGHVLVGNIGATQRREFTVIGDAVNLASRLEGVTKPFHTDFCIGETVYAWLGDEFLVRTLGLITVKGKTKPTRIYEVLDDLKGIEPMNFFSPDWARRYEAGFEAYLARDFAKGVELFQQCLTERTGDFCSEVYLQACREFLITPPPENWDGVQKMDSK